MGIAKTELKMKNDQLLEKFFSKDRVALARMISRVENDQSITDSVLDQVFKNVKGAYRIGITGPPGAGKSTLVDGLTTLIRKKNRSVGVIAVDPTSPFTGGALLGDRIRMFSNQGDQDVFIRSMATRGNLGGLAYSTQEAADVMDAFGFDIVIMETVGVGQSELDIIEAADSVIVVLVPESGDSIQAMKAGLMEISDIFVLNKSDHENADQAFVELNSILSLKTTKDEWKLPIVKTVAHQIQGLDELMKEIDSHQSYLKAEKRLQKKRRNRIRKRFLMKIKNKLQFEFWDDNKNEKFESLVKKLHKGELTYKQALGELF